MGGKRKPEQEAPPEFYFNEQRARKYDASRATTIQTKLTERALEMLNFPDDGTPKLLLDIGCGTCLSGKTLSDSDKGGHHWIGVDISRPMLDVALEDEVDGDLLLGDIGQGVALRPGVIDGAVSISVVQWLLQAGKSCHDPYKRLKSFFDSLYKCLAPGGKAVLQVYLDHVTQGEILNSKALGSGFTGCIITDYPNSTLAKKFFLFLVVPGVPYTMPRPKDGPAPAVYYENEQEELLGSETSALPGPAAKRRKLAVSEWQSVQVSVRRRSTKKKGESRREYVLRMKARQRACGKMDVRKYSGRRRKSRRF